MGWGGQGAGTSETKLGRALLSASVATVGAEVEFTTGPLQQPGMRVGGEAVKLYTKTGRLIRQQVSDAPEGELQWRPAGPGPEAGPQLGLALGQQWPATDGMVTDDYTANGAFLSYSESRQRLGPGLAIDTLVRTPPLPSPNCSEHGWLRAGATVVQRIHDADTNGGPGATQASGSLDQALLPEGMLAGLRALRADGEIAHVSLGMNAHTGLMGGRWTPAVIVDFIRAAPPGTFDSALLACASSLS